MAAQGRVAMQKCVTTKHGVSSSPWRETIGCLTSAYFTLQDTVDTPHVNRHDNVRTQRCKLLAGQSLTWNAQLPRLHHLNTFEFSQEPCHATTQHINNHSVRQQ